MIVLWALAGLGALAWFLSGSEFLLARWRPAELNKLPAEGPEPLPRLSIVVSALDEALTIESAMRTLLAQDYPELEIIAVNDRSTDSTGEILARLAAEDPRLKVVTVSELPAGWLGKNHAQEVGGKAASGDYILFTDADVHFEPTTLQRAVRHALNHQIDMLIVFPHIVLEDFWETLSVSFFGVMFALNFKPWKISDPKSSAHMGVGAFNMVRAAAYRKMGGHEALKMDIADDVKLGKKMKQSGARLECVYSMKMVRVRWVVGLRGIITGLTKNMFAGMSYSLSGAILAILALLVVVTWPGIGLFVGPPLMRLLCVYSLLCMVITARMATPGLGITPLYGLLYPVASLIIIYIILRSVFMTYRQGGVMWRGTLYPLDELKKGVV